MNRLWAVTRWSPVITGGLALLLFSSPVQGEMYVAGQIGAHIPNDASNVKWSGIGGEVGGSDLAM